MPVHRGAFGGAAQSPPTVSISPTTNFNENRATFNATVNPNYMNTSVAFQYSTNQTTWTTAGTVSGLNGTSQSVFFNATGLSPGNAYYVRAIATSLIGAATSGNTMFTTWSLKTYLNTTAGSYSVSVPSITPTGASAISPTIYEMLIYGAGGAAAHGGGGGGGYRISASLVSPTAGPQTVMGTVGAGGTNPSNVIPGPSGGNTTLTLSSASRTANGGAGGNNFTSAAGSSGSGDNTSKAGGVGHYGYTYISGYNQQVVGYNLVVTGYNNYCCSIDKNGNCTEWCPDYNSPIYSPDYNSPIYGNNPNSPIYSTDYSRYSGGGGGGTDAAGSNATYPDGGGAGGAGGGAYGLRGGNGGGGGGTSSTGGAGGVSGTGPVVGTGGTGFWASGVAGGVTFKYYGP